MEQLIKITQHKGKIAVSAKELFIAIDFKGNNFTKFCTRYITKNEYAVEGIDYQCVVLQEAMPNGGIKLIKDYIVTLEFAKKISMMVHTEVGDNVRDYFLAFEEKAKHQSSLSLIIPTSEELLL